MTAQPLDWPPLEPSWFSRWMEQDDARRAALMAAAANQPTSSRVWYRCTTGGRDYRVNFDLAGTPVALGMRKTGRRSLYA